MPKAKKRVIELYIPLRILNLSDNEMIELIRLHINHPVSSQFDREVRITIEEIKPRSVEGK